ncbi:hypothetical protein BXZ70DRAFT_918378 [Cristinia sonorae]|uniref:DNA replication checkpoint mediator MRC1 domain-containing protein n=1 Tax=Cristinia sonorae TaxID=1940300 RepID=A0A8K0UW31_9AGAR|nr:hypothetical protein BXZ70DRAFT_918378 [Cristinia sonorae]
MSSDSSPMIVRRAPRTYGRRPKEPDNDNDFSLADTSIVSNASSLEEPPNSDGIDASFSLGGLSNDEESYPASHFVVEGNDQEGCSRRTVHFAWQKALYAMNDSDDEEGQALVRREVANLNATSLSEDDRETPNSHSPKLATRGSPRRPLLSESSLTELTDSPAPSPRVFTRPIKARPELGLDAEEETEPSSPQTPSHTLHHLNTPQRHSSPTPPTSTETAPRKQKAAAAKLPQPRFGKPGDASDDEKSTGPDSRNKKSRKSKEKRIRAPTKKQREETSKATARIKASATAEVPRGQTKLLTLGKLFHNVHLPFTQGASTGHGKTRSVIVPPSDDTIQPFSSPRATEHTAPGPSASWPPADSHVNSNAKTDDIPAELTDDDLPDIRDVLRQTRDAEDERKRVERNSHLAAERKKRALELLQQQPQPSDASDDDDIIVSNDMHAIAQEESELRRRQKILGVSSSKTQRHIRKARGPVIKSETTADLSLIESAGGAFHSPTKKYANSRDRPKLSTGYLNRLLLKKSELDARAIIEEKERDWQGMGGKVLGRQDAEALGFSGGLGSIIERGLQHAATVDDHDDEQGASHSEDSDAEWQPTAGRSHSLDDDDVDDAAEEDAVMDIAHEDQTSSVENGDPMDDEDQLVAPRRRVRGPIVTSDDEGEPSRGSSEENPENETDKENNAALMFDQGEDKENTAIHFSPSQPALFREVREAQRLSSDVESPRLPGDRGPFREISKDDDPFFTPSARMPPPRTLSFDLSANDDSENNPFALKPAPILHGGISQLFESSTEAGPSRVTSFSQFVTPAKDSRGFAGLRKDDGGLSLTLNPTLRPALEVTDSVRKKAEQIFEKEQEVAFGDENTATPSGPQMFVNDNGFLTQTRPSNTDVSRLMSSSQSSRFGRSPSLLSSVQARSTGQRRPLGEIDIDDGVGSEDTPLSDARPDGGRLKRRRMSPEATIGGYRSSISPSPSPIKHRSDKNAFQLMRDAGVKPIKPMKKLKRSDFVDGQAEESDEDADFGFGGRSKREDDEEDEEENQEELEKLNQEMVDDVAMDATTLNEEMVLEKHREQLEQDDAVQLKIAEDMAAGKLRAKQRQRGVGFEDDEDSDEDERNAARRQKLARQKRRIGDHDSLHALGKDDKSAPFVHAYEAALEDGAEEFSHLNEDSTEIVRNDDDEDDDEDEENRNVTMSDLVREMRDVAQGRSMVNVHDPNDISWVDQDDDVMAIEEDIEVKEVSRMKTSRPRTSEWDFEADRLRPNNSRQGEALSRGGGMGRSVGGSAITGHARAKRGDGSINGQRGAAGSKVSVKQTTKPISKAPSKLSAVSSRRGHFAD